MNECACFAEVIRAHVAGESVPDDGGALARHAEHCTECRALLALHGTLADLGADLEEPEPARFAAMRAAVVRQISPAAQAGRVVPLQPRRRAFGWPASPVVRALAAAAAVVLVFLTGYAAAWVARGARGERTTVPSANGEPLLSEITAEAASNRSLNDVEDSPFIYSDVTFRALDDGRVALEFDVTRHVSTVEAAGSPLVQDVLAQSLLNPTHTGSRLKAISLASAGAMAPKVRDALIFALHHDDNLAVRLKALGILSQQGSADAAIEAAVLETLQGDPSVQMRLSALDYLAEQRLDPAAIRRAIEQTDTNDPAGAALMVRLDEYENKSRR